MHWPRSRRRPVALRRPDAVRPWQHVLDCLDGYLTLAEALDREPDSYSGEWNFGPPDSDCLSVAEIAEELAERMGVRSAWVQDAREQSPEEEILRLDASKAAELLGWRTTLPLSTTLDWAAEWHRGFQSGHDAADLCRAQIAAYMDLRPGVAHRKPTRSPHRLEIGDIVRSLSTLWPTMGSVAILGTGMAGFGAWHRLRDEPHEVVLYDKRSYAGGHTTSWVFPAGFTFDEGPHVSFTKDERIQTILADAVGGEFEESSISWTTTGADTGSHTPSSAISSVSPSTSSRA